MSQSANAGALLTSAANDGVISGLSLQALNLVDIGGAINAGLGTTVNLKTPEVLLAGILIDDSGSIRFTAGNTEAVRQGHNTVIEALSASKQKDSVSVACRYLNGGWLYQFSTLEQAIRMDASNFNPRGGTPFYDESMVILGAVLAEQQHYAEIGQVARTATLLVSDGNDEHSLRAQAKDVAKVVRDMLRAETNIVAAMGIDDGSTDFRKVFGEMGIPDEWILTPKNTPSEIRKAFQVFSQSAVRASQGGASFSQVAAGGFGA
ncbi:MAG: hypothetical protein WCT16_03865 [Candidatus Buchananbacteria bacterium]